MSGDGSTMSGAIIVSEEEASGSKFTTPVKKIKSSEILLSARQCCCIGQPISLDDDVTFEILIMETTIGGLIGRCGSNISRIGGIVSAMIKRKFELSKIHFNLDGHRANYLGCINVHQDSNDLCYRACGGCVKKVENEGGPTQKANIVAKTHGT
ncbi:hypothetical protein PIB30_085803 [Stylosanthes scabra]|uniref:K Homology domain-containing protein n=1 Tax=Stylosanthes scabra TaxID=79078 RepID=A0ABU6UTR6_9FABA|nr:hypothetical protein [Stylosanthes scabra]